MPAWPVIREDKVLMRFLFVFLLFAAPAFADESPSLTGQQWLTKIDLAMKSLSYQGTVVFFKNGQIDAMKYRHGFEDGAEIERLTSLNSPLREVVRKSSEVTCLYKETSKKEDGHHPIDRSFIVNLPQTSSDLDPQYLLAVAGQEMVAMRSAQVIAVLPKDEMRYARKIWVDSETALPLKVEIYGLDGNILEQVLFTELKVEENAGNKLAVSGPNRSHDQHHHVVAAEAFEKSAYQLKNWPIGFEAVFFVRNSLQKSQKSVDHLLISDGFSDISIYFENKGSQPIEGLRSLGAVNTYSRVIGDTQVTVLGEVPAKTVQFIAAGIALR